MSKDIRYHIIAIDFDGCICDGGFYDISKGTLIQSTKDRMFEIIKNSILPVEFILWTCRIGVKLEEAKEFCKLHDLPKIKYFNEQHPTTFTWMEDAANVRKIFAHEYWDDRAVKVAKKPIIDTPFTKIEREISTHINHTVVKFKELPQTHPSDIPEFVRAIHDLQKILGMRVLRRTFPNEWPDKSNEGVLSNVSNRSK